MTASRASVFVGSAVRTVFLGMGQVFPAGSRLPSQPGRSAERTLHGLILLAPLLFLAAASGADDDKAAKSKGKEKAPVASSPDLDPAREADALTFVREHHPELAKVLEALKPMNPGEYRKAIIELSQVSRNLLEIKGRNPKRYELALDVWKAKSRVELLAAQLAGSPVEEIRSQLRSAIEARIEAEIARQRYELEQAEAAARKARESLDRLESNRESLIEARLRALEPKKPGKAKKPASTPKAAVTTPANPPAKVKTNPNGEDR
jgi:hypothetical protein